MHYLILLFVNVKILKSPNLSELVDFISRAHTRGNLITIHATCEVDYRGYRTGEIGEGDRIIICKEDGAVAVHRPTGARAVARQGIESSFETILNGDYLRLYAAKGREEKIRIDITSCSLVIESSAVDNAILQENKTEGQMHQYIRSNPEAIEKNLRILEHERRTPYGRVDFYAADDNGNNVLLEIKRPVAELPHVDQLCRYIDHFRQTDEPKIRGILVAPSIGSKVKRSLRDQGLEWKQLREYKDNTTAPSQTSVEDWQ